MSPLSTVELLRLDDNAWRIPADARAVMRDAADEIDRLRKATGGLDPALVAKALNDYRIFLEVEPNVALTVDERAALDAATFEVPE